MTLTKEIKESLTLLAEGPRPAHQAATGSAHVVAQGLVVALTPMSTAQAEHPSRAL